MLKVQGDDAQLDYCTKPLVLFLRRKLPLRARLKFGAIKLAIVAACLSVVAQSINAQPSLAKNPTPKDQLIWARLIQQSYPAAAAREELQGSVRVKVSVKDDGRVAQCFVIQSSGHQILDKAACDGMTQFAIFHPAIDNNGRPTNGTFSTIITYKLNQRQAPSSPPRPQTPSVTT